MVSRVHIIIHGAVQGVGFRPFVYRLASEMGLKGNVLNSTNGVHIEAESQPELLRQFILRLEKEKPRTAYIQSLEYSFLDSIGYQDFIIRESSGDQDISAFILPDIAVCPDCLREMNDPEDRRYLYPFINCTNCGPRFSIIEKLPYDRPNTSMKIFTMCDACREEYEDPVNRRFHAQPIACPECGPQIELWGSSGKILETGHEALLRTTELIREGLIIGLKGIGGFQLLVNGMDAEAIARLRLRKRREEKPFALMFPNIEIIKDVSIVSEFEERLLYSPESPIVLLKRKVGNDKKLALEEIAPQNPNLGIMLPYSPLHHLLLDALKIPVIATSGNISDEPICIDEFEAVQKLGQIADFFLVHNRPIVRQVDDSIVRVILGRELVLRRARGYAPLPISLGKTSESPESDENYLALGAHLKNTVAIGKGRNIFVSQHIGDLATAEANNAFEKVIRDFRDMYQINHPIVVSDLHPDYLSTKYGENHFPEVERVQHHLAHFAACMAENQLDDEVIGVSWDGTGYGEDGAIWGGEFFCYQNGKYEHVAQLRKFPLPGGDLAIKEPRRSALGILYEIYAESIFRESNLLPGNFSGEELNLFKQMLIKNINCPKTSSAGRLFDAVASLLNIRQKINYEGQAAMMLEFSVATSEKGHYSFTLSGTDPLVIDWQPMIEKILHEIKEGTSGNAIAMKFHRTLAAMILNVCQRLSSKKVALTGGCFQNAILLERTVTLLRENDFVPYWHQRIPPNDGGISLGQIAYLKSVKRYNQTKTLLESKISFEKEVK
jgi:hydrogenase maturation protein HypF